MNLSEIQLKQNTTVFHGMVPGRKANLPIITLHVAFNDVNNYRRE
jgi:hypothetical protein